MMVLVLNCILAFTLPGNYFILLYFKSDMDHIPQQCHKAFQKWSDSIKIFRKKESLSKINRFDLVLSVFAIQTNILFSWLEGWQQMYLEVGLTYAICNVLVVCSLFSNLSSNVFANFLEDGC